MVADTAPRDPLLPREPVPWRPTVGTRPVDPATWLDLGADADAQLAEKRRQLALRPEEVVVALPGTAAAAGEMLDAVVEHLLAHNPARCARDGGGRLVDPRDGRPLLPDDADRLHPLDAAGRLVPEDLCLHLPDADGVLRLVAGSVAFPSRWRLADKVGLPVAAVHVPVPGYAASLGGPVDRLLARLAPGRLLARTGWTLHEDPALAQPPAPAPPAPASQPPVPAVPDGVWLRTERQTLRRLPVHGSVVFTIRTRVTPLAALGGDATARTRLAAALDGMPDALAAYKALRPPVRAAVVAWLAGAGAPAPRAAGGPPASAGDALAP